MTKKNFYLLPALFVLLLFQGCLNYYQETVIKTDNSGDMFIHYWMKLSTSQDSVIISQIGIFQADSIRNEFTSRNSSIDDIDIYFDNNDSTIHAKVELEFKDIDSLNQARAFRESNYSVKDGAAGQKIFSQFISPAVTGFGINGDLFTVTYVYYMPGEIITHNANKKSNNKLTWEYKLSDIGMGKTITATYRPFKLKETPVWIYGLALFVLIIVVVFLFKKNKS